MLYYRCGPILNSFNPICMGQKSSNKHASIWHHSVLSIFELLFNLINSKKSRISYENFSIIFWLFSKQENLFFMELFYFILFLYRCRCWSRISTISYFTYSFYYSNFSHFWKKNKKSKYSYFFPFVCRWWIVHFSEEILYKHKF